MAPGFFSKLVKPPTGSRHSSDRASATTSDGVSRSGSPSPKSSSSSSPPRSLPISTNLTPSLVVQAPPSPSHGSLSSEPSVTVIPPSPRSFNSSLHSDHDSPADVPSREEKSRGRERPTSLVNLNYSPTPETDSGMPTPTPVSRNTLGVNGSNNTRPLTPSSSTGNLRDRVRSVVSRSSSRSRSRTNQAESPAPPLPGPPDAASTAAVSHEMQIHHAQPPGHSNNGAPGLFIVPPAPGTTITGTRELQTSPTSVGGPTPKTRAFTVPANNPTATPPYPESRYLTPDRVKDSDSVSIASTASGRRRLLWRRSSTTTSTSSNTPSMAAPSPKRKTAGLASAIVASVSSSGGGLTASPPASPPRRKGSVVKRSPALSGHQAATSRSSLDSNLSPATMRSHHDSLSSRSQEQDGYGSSADGQDEDADDDSDDDALLAELNDGDIPVTGFAVASNKRNADFHELFRTIPEGDYLIEDYGCALQREILVQGRIYISENHICFYANIFGWITNLVIPIYEIVSLEKKMTAFVIPNAIQITTRTTKYSFASFLARDTAHDVIYNIWRLARPEDGFSEDETSGRPALDASHALRITSPTESGAIPIGSMAPLTHKATTCACGREGKHYSEIAIDTVIPGTPERIYNLMFASGFLKDFMRDNQKLEDIQISDWAPMPTDQNCLARNMSYIKRLNGSIGPKSAKCEIRDETLYCDFDDYVATLTTARTPDVPSGGAFSVKTRTCITWASSASSRIVVSSQVEWTGRSFIKGIIEKSAIEGQRTYQRELDRAMRVYIQEHQTEFIPAGLDPASVVVAVEGDTAVPTTATGPVPQNEEAARKEREKEREQERNQRSIQWAYDTFEGAMSVGRQSTSVAIELIRDAWDQSSTSTILYFAIALLVLSNLWTLVLVGQREEAGRRKEVRRTEEREKWVQGIVTALWEELAAGRQPGTSSLPSSPQQQQQQQQQQHQSVPVNVQLPESWREEVAEIMGALDAVEERVQLIRRSLADLD